MSQGIFISDYLGLIVGCAVGLAAFKACGPAALSDVLPCILAVWFASCAGALAAGPGVMLPRVMRWGAGSLSPGEAAWLFTGTLVGVISVGALPGHATYGVLIVLLIMAVGCGGLSLALLAHGRFRRRWTDRFGAAVIITTAGSCYLLFYFAVIWTVIR